jgi:hypothetical protein
LVPIDAGFSQCVIKQSASRAYKRFAGEILLVAWLFAHEHNL